MPFTSASGRANWKEPPLPVEHHRPGLTRRVFLRHAYTPWVPLTAWDRYSWSGRACPIMPSCHGARQAPPLPAAAAVLKHSSGEGWLVPGGLEDVDSHPLLPKCTGLFPTTTPSSPLQLGPCSESPLWPWRQHSQPAQGDVPRSKFRAAVQVWGAPWDGCAPSFMCVWLRVVRPSPTGAGQERDVAGAGTVH